MKLYNSLSRKLEEFRPIKAGEVSLYTCGPTVYDHVHIGNLRTYIFEDTLRRVMKSNGLKLKHVMNITDVDDKTIARSHENYPADEPREALRKLTAKYEKIFYADAKKVGIDLGNSRIVKATEHIEDMQALIRQIPGKYITKDGIYFNIEKYNDYGRLVKLDRSHSHHRINNDEYDKDHVADFALWKTKSGDEPAWDFEIEGKNLEGRPGWHIECSAMSVKYLSQPFDIHTGGVDLIFPHHENEIAQSSSAGGQPLAKYFLHGEHLLVDDHKMSKSLKNFYTIDDILSKGFDPLAFRLLVLQVHYRHQLNFTWRSLESAQAFLQRLQTWADLKFQPKLGHKKDVGMNYTKILTSIKQSLSDDLNSGQGLAILSGLVNRAEQEGVDTNKLQLLLEQLDELLGLDLAQRSDISNSVKDLISARETARKKSDWARADELRKKLSTEGIELNDTPHGPVWTRS
ncbi:MAG: Cysteine-tRNA ligase [Parcubacteria group bacterium GW2011_GWA2_49_16]|nr:MAG: Cysteine-tRNA ligase [Parcubacteria group bacterium GW2011_GWA2_49_16]